MQAVVATVFAYVSRSLFNADRLTFALHLAFSVAATKAQAGSAGTALPEHEWEHLTKGTALPMGSFDARSTTSIPRWLPSTVHASFTALARAHPELLAPIASSEGEWADWFQRPHAETLPPSASHLSPLQKTLVVQALRPDRLHTSLVALALSELAIRGLAPGTLSMTALQEQADSKTPLLLLATPGGDPSQEVQEYCLR